MLYTLQFVPSSYLYAAFIIVYLKYLNNNLQNEHIYLK